jgi:methylated-DNA-protein-cysteine methyltransferase-like protein
MKSEIKKARTVNSFAEPATAKTRILAAIRQVPYGKVSTYGAIARAAGLGRGARQVAAALRSAFGLPWHRILGAGGQIKLRGNSAFEQRMRLESEGVIFRGKRVNMSRHEYKSPKSRVRYSQQALSRRSSR